MAQEGCAAHPPLPDWAKAQSPWSLSSWALPSLKLSSVFWEPARNRPSTFSGGWKPAYDFFLMIPELLPRESLTTYWKELKWELKAGPPNGDHILSAFRRCDTIGGKRQGPVKRSYLVSSNRVECVVRFKPEASCDCSGWTLEETSQSFHCWILCCSESVLDICRWSAFN